MRTKPTVKVMCGKIDAVPLVDVMFLLMIFFLISTSLVFQPGIAVDLPTARSASMRGAEKIVVTITPNDQLFFNDNRVEWDELERELRELLRNSRAMMEKQRGDKPATATIQQGRSPMLVLRADASVNYARIVQVMSLARSLNLGVYLATDIEPAGGTRALRGARHR
jgi:biopolymer transport protein ExbD